MSPESLLRAPGGSLDGFPAHDLPAGSLVFRTHRQADGPWFFDDGPEGRFNLPAGSGEGTCYLAADPVGAFLEVFWRMRVVSDADVRVRAQFTAELSGALRLADLTAKAVGRFGINAEIHTTPDYLLHRAWAEALRSAGFDGLRYLTRSDPGMRQVGYALFGPAGAIGRTSLALGSSGPIGEEIIELAAGYGVLVLPALP
jgi:hypothetical protein